MGGAVTEGERWMGLVARVPCVLCTHMGLGDSPAEVHHLKFQSGACNETSDLLTIAACPRHHRVEYPDSIHRLKEHGLMLRYKVSELDLLAMTIAGVVRLLAQGARLR